MARKNHPKHTSQRRKPKQTFDPSLRTLSMAVAR